MKMVVAYIRHEAFEPIRTELLELGFPSLSITEVKGSGRQRGITERYRGAELTNYLRPKLKVECVVDDGDVETIIHTILKHARTGAVGDGKMSIIRNYHMTMLKMLSLAGGATSTAKVKNSVILRKNPDTGKRDQVPVDLRKVMNLKTEDVQLESNDILFVPDSNGLKALHRAGDIAISLTTGVGLVAVGRI